MDISANYIFIHPPSHLESRFEFVRRATCTGNPCLSVITTSRPAATTPQPPEGSLTRSVISSESEKGVRTLADHTRRWGVDEQEGSCTAAGRSLRLVNLHNPTHTSRQPRLAVSSSSNLFVWACNCVHPLRTPEAARGRVVSDLDETAFAHGSSQVTQLRPPWLGASSRTVSLRMQSLCARAAVRMAAPDGLAKPRRSLKLCNQAELVSRPTRGLTLPLASRVQTTGHAQTTLRYLHQVRSPTRRRRPRPLTDPDPLSLRSRPPRPCTPSSRRRPRPHPSPTLHHPR